MEKKKKLWYVYIYIYIYIYIYKIKHSSAIKKNEVLPLVTMWMDFEGTLLSEISQTKKGTYHMLSLIVESNFHNDNEKPTTKLIDTENTLVNCQR